MDDAPRVEPLLVYAAATAHAVGIVLLLVSTLHWTGAGFDFLDGVGTLPGLAIFGLIWLAAWGSLRAALAGLDLSGRLPVATALARGGLWGGLAAFAIVLVIALVAAAATGELGTLAFGGFASAFAFVVGVGVGLVFAALDLAAAGIARRLLVSPGARSP